MGDKAKCVALNTWLENHSSEEIQEVFNSLNVNESQTIDFTDFLTLSLHTAMASMQRMAHFQSWIVQTFGQSQDAFRRAFDTLDIKHQKKLNVKNFCQAAQTFGYP